MGCWGRMLPQGCSGLPSSSPEQLKIPPPPPFLYHTSQGVAATKSAMQTRPKLNQLHAREKAVNPCRGGTDASLRGHRHCHGSEGRAGARNARHPPGPKPHRDGGLPPSPGNGGCGPMVGLSHRLPPPQLPQLPAIWPGRIKSMKKLERNEVRAVMAARGRGEPAPSSPSPAAGPLVSPAGPDCGTSRSRDGSLGYPWTPATGTQSKPQP